MAIGKVYPDVSSTDKTNGKVYPDVSSTDKTNGKVYQFVFGYLDNICHVHLTIFVSIRPQSCALRTSIGRCSCALEQVCIKTDSPLERNHSFFDWIKQVSSS